VIFYQDLLSKTQAANFGESLHTLIEHLETQQHQLASALQDTTTTLQVLKRLNGGQPEQMIDSSVVNEIAHLEAITLPQLQSMMAPIAADLEVSSSEDELTDTQSAAKSLENTQAKSKGRRVSTPKTPQVSSKGEDAPADNRFSANFHPRRSVLKEFQGKILREALKTILKRKQGQPVSIDEVMLALYGKNISEKNAEIARTVVIHELSKGKSDGHWTGVPQRKGYYWIQE
jgi:hypothetical protein